MKMKVIRTCADCEHYELQTQAQMYPEYGDEMNDEGACYYEFRHGNPQGSIHGIPAGCPLPDVPSKVESNTSTEDLHHTERRQRGIC